MPLSLTLQTALLQFLTRTLKTPLPPIASIHSPSNSLPRCALTRLKLKLLSALEYALLTPFYRPVYRQERAEAPRIPTRASSRPATAAQYSTATRVSTSITTTGSIRVIRASLYIESKEIIACHSITSSIPGKSKSRETTSSKTRVHAGFPNHKSQVLDTIRKQLECLARVSAHHRIPSTAVLTVHSQFWSSHGTPAGMTHRARNGEPQPAHIPHPAQNTEQKRDLKSWWKNFSRGNQKRDEDKGKLALHLAGTLN